MYEFALNGRGDLLARIGWPSQLIDRKWRLMSAFDRCWGELLQQAPSDLLPLGEQAPGHDALDLAEPLTHPCFSAHGL